jgi:hypothetical protein
MTRVMTTTTTMQGIDFTKLHLGRKLFDEFKTHYRTQTALIN